MSDAVFALSLPTLPTIVREDLLPAGLLALLASISIAGRTWLAWQAMRRQSQRLDAAALRLETAADVERRLVTARPAAASLNAGLERALWKLPEFDRRTAATAERLAGFRRQTDDWHGENGKGARHAIGAARGALEWLSAVRRLRRVIQR